jgi:type II secretory pathway pseudopilin PulG
MMKKLLIVASLVAPLVAVAAEAANSSAAQASRQDKKSVAMLCQQQVDDMKLEGAEKKKFLVKCRNLHSAKATPAAK